MTYTPAMVTTIDGRQCLADSEEWRKTCEAVRLLNTPHKERPALLELVQKFRSAAGRRLVEDEMSNIEPAYLLAMGNRDARRAYLEQVETYLGIVAREHLEARIVALWEQRKAEKAA